MLTISGVGDSPAVSSQRAGRQTTLLNFASDLLTAEGVTFIRFAALVTLRPASAVAQSSRLRSSVVMDFLHDAATGRPGATEHNQQQAYYAGK